MGQAEKLDPINSVNLFYSVTLTDHEDNELFQLDFPQLELAIEALNSRYGHWDFIDPSVTSGGGCGTCAAH